MKKIIKVLLITITILSFNFVYAKVNVPENIRVGLYYGSTAKDKITITSSTSMLIEAEYGADEELHKIDKNSTVVLEVDQKLDDYVKLYVDNVIIDGLKGKIVISFEEDKNNDIKFKLNNKEYRGSLEVERINNGENLTVINKIPLEQYLYSVVPSEIETSSHIEAIKAQAVAARTYTVSSLNRHENFDLCATTHCQMYRGTEWESSKTRGAVDDTAGKIITYNDKPISAVYFATSGGHTEDVENVWTNALPYLRGVEDKYEPKTNPWVVTYTKDELEELLSKKGVNIGELVNLEVLEYTDSGRVYKIRFTGTKGTKEYTKESTRTIFGLKSQLYTITSNSDGESNTEETAIISYIDENDNIKEIDVANNNVLTADGNKVTKHTSILTADGEKNINVESSINTDITANEYVFTGYGSGHGIGMSQNGAKGMANEGFTYDEILKHYYTGITIQG